MKPAEAARRLEINRSSLKRYLDHYPELVDERGRVNFEELAAHRADNLQVADSAGAKTPKVSASPETPTRRSSKLDLEQIKLWEAQREWAKSIGQLVDPTEMTDEMAEAAVALRDKFMAPDPVLCERLAGESDPRTVMTLIREANRPAIEDFAAQMKAIRDKAMKRIADNEDESANLRISASAPPEHATA